MIFAKVKEPNFELYACGSFWLGAKQGEPPPEHLLLTGAVVCDGPRCWCHKLRAIDERTPE